MLKSQMLLAKLSHSIRGRKTRGAVGGGISTSPLLPFSCSNPRQGAAPGAQHCLVFF